MRLFLVLLIFPIISVAQPTSFFLQKKDSLYLYAQNRIIFSARVLAGTGEYNIHQQSFNLGGVESEIITINSNDFSNLSLIGIVYAKDESIACQSEPRDKGLRVVRNVLGTSHNLNNNAVYDRASDWLLSMDFFYASIKVSPIKENQYEISAKGWEIVIRFRPNFYKIHRGLKYFAPNTYSVWRKPIVGWCSWYAYLDNVNEKEIKNIADVLSDKMKPYGLDYVQVDDGYEQRPIGRPASWLIPNQKFPSGLKNLANYIKEKGLKPGLWTNVAFEDSGFVIQNKKLFVKDYFKNIAKGNWIDYIMDGSNKEVIRRLIMPVYKELNLEGWQYFKLDALRHLKYEGYNAHKDFFHGNSSLSNKALRNIVMEVRKQIGSDKFLLGCWGIRPELIGLIDGCRIGNDGFSYAGLAQFNSYNNIIWRNDPDHIVLDKNEAYRSCVATSITGSVFMLTDKSEVYQDSGLLEAPRRTVPVLFTQPGQVYDVDPSRSNQIQQADIEITGSGPRIFDASSATTTGLFSLEINRDFENWLILARLDDRDSIISFKDLGLDEGKRYLLYEFWTKKFMGAYTNNFKPGPIDTTFHCQVFCIREMVDHPQLLATNRHISCGAVEIENIHWAQNKLDCISQTIPKEIYVAYIYENERAVYQKVTCEGCKVLESKKQGFIREVHLEATGGTKIHFTIEYE